MQTDKVAHLALGRLKVVVTIYRDRSQDVAQDMEQREQWSAQASAALCALYSISCATSCDRARYITQIWGYLKHFSSGN